MANLEENVTPPFQLIHTPDGWEGGAEFFRVSQNVIKIKNTDAHENHVPREERRQWTTDEEGNFSQYERIQDPKHHIFRLWMYKIGPYLADWVLGKNPYDSPPWKLLRFPDNYTLWVHKTGVDTDPANPRTDAYLYGAPHLGRSRSRSPSQQQLAPTVFRSPMEFVEHAIWLMKGCVDPCQCKYCQPGQSQKEINFRLNHDVEVKDEEPESDGGGGSAGIATGTRNASSSSSSSSSRLRRGAGAGSRGQRRGKRDRSPPIMAKDYRVNAPDMTT